MKKKNPANFARKNPSPTSCSALPGFGTPASFGTAEGRWSSLLFRSRCTVASVRVHRLCERSLRRRSESPPGSRLALLFSPRSPISLESSLPPRSNALPQDNLVSRARPRASVRRASRLGIAGEVVARSRRCLRNLFHVELTQPKLRTEGLDRMLLRVSLDLTKAGLGSRNLTPWNMASKLGLLSLKLSTTAASSNKVVDVAAQEGEFRVFIMAGEVSGDSIASRLMVSLKKLSPLPVRFAGVGGFFMSKEGLQTLFPMEEISVMGLWELLPHLNTIRKKLKETTEAAILFRPHVVITVDSKGFSFRLLKQLKAKYLLEDTCPVLVHYVAPSFWAWKGGEARLQNLCQFVDHMLCIIPFEEEICRLNGLAATYVGHPLLEDALMLNLDSGFMSNNLKVHRSGDVFRHEHGISPGATVITLLPGSRLQEVKRILPIFLRTMEIIRNSFSELSVIILVAPNNHVKDFVDKAIQSSSLSAILVPGASLDQKYEAFSASTAALCSSGSAVIELQLARLPCIVAYQTHILTELVIHYRTKLKYISLPNILMNASIIPEVLFRDCTPGNLATILSELILDKNIQEEQISTAEKFLRLLCPPSKNVNMLLEDLFSGVIWCPSMIAASTILSIETQKRD